MPSMPDWLNAALEAAAQLPPAQRLPFILQAVHNEMEHGGGTTAPVAVTQALVDGADAIQTALAGKVAKPAAEPEKADAA